MTTQLASALPPSNPTPTPIEIHLNSSYGTASGDQYHNNMYWQLPRSLYAPEGFSFYITLLSFSLPISWYIVTTNNQTLVIDGTSFSIPIGNYTVYTLLTALNALVPQTVTYDKSTNRYTFSSDDSFSLDNDSTCLGLIGFSTGASGTSVTSDLCADLTGENSIYVLTQFNESNVDCRTGNIGSVLARVPILEPHGSVAQYLDFSGRAGIRVEDDTISYIQILLEDESRQPLQAQIPWEATLQLQFVPSDKRYMTLEDPNKDASVELDPAFYEKFSSAYDNIEYPDARIEVLPNDG